MFLDLFVNARTPQINNLSIRVKTTGFTLEAAERWRLIVGSIPDDWISFIKLLYHVVTRRNILVLCCLFKWNSISGNLTMIFPMCSTCQKLVVIGMYWSCCFEFAPSITILYYETLLQSSILIAKTKKRKTPHNVRYPQLHFPVWRRFNKQDASWPLENFSSTAEADSTVLRFISAADNVESRTWSLLTQIRAWILLKGSEKKTRKWCA